VAQQDQRVQGVGEAVTVLVRFGQRGVKGHAKELMRGLRLAVAVEEQVCRGHGRVQRLVERGVVASRVTQKLAGALELPAGQRAH
jgi:hypothetical protein